MIHVICPNPALDRSIFVSSFEPNTIIRPDSVRDVLGGKGFNVIRPFFYLNYTDYKVHTLLGGYIGHSLQKMISDNHVNVEVTHISENNRVCSIVINENENNTYQIYEQGPEIQNKELNIFTQKILDLTKPNDIVIFSGSLPIGVSAEFYKSLILKLQEKNIKCLLDSSADALKSGIQSKPWLVKINDEEFLELIGENKDYSEEDMIGFIKQYSLTNNLIVTLGSKGIIAKFDDVIYKVDQPKIKAINPIASGDIFLGILAKKLTDKADLEETLIEACSYSLSNCLHWYPNIDSKEIQYFINKIKIKQI